MLYHLLFPLRDIFFGFNVFKYISFRAIGAAITALLILFMLGPKTIAWLTKMQIGEVIRSYGPESHKAKQGTPTMGGLLVLFSIIIPTLLWARLDNLDVWLLMLATAWMGAIGFLDDYLKVIKKYPKGLIAKYKLIGQISLGLIIGFTLYFYPDNLIYRTATSLPFVANGYIDLRWFYIPFVIFVVTGTSNAVNLTDGLDGLATGLTAIAVLSFGAISYATGRFDFSDYLNIIYLPRTGELLIFSLAMAGACIGFLWYNAYPAKIFMGDTGSLAMGAALGTLAILLKKEILLIVIGGIFVAESLSVMIQVVYFKYSKKKYGEARRVFLMAPLHHHFELKGWHESHVVVRFWIVGIILALLSLTTFKVQ